MLDKIKRSVADYLETSGPELGRDIVARCLSVIVTIVLTFLLIQLLHWVVNRLMKRKRNPNKRLNTLRKLINSVITYALSILALVQIMQSAFHVNLTSIMAAAGILGVAVGFGAQSLVKDIIAGFFILLEGQYSVGDRVTISGFTGLVDELGLRSTRVRDEQGDLFIIPNGSIANLVNHSLLPDSFFIACLFPSGTDSNAMLALFDKVGKKAQEDLSPLAKTPVPSVCPAPDGDGYSVRLKVVCQPNARELLEKELPHRLQKALVREDAAAPQTGFEIIRE